MRVKIVICGDWGYDGNGAIYAGDFNVNDDVKKIKEKVENELTNAWEIYWWGFENPTNKDIVSVGEGVVPTEDLIRKMIKKLKGE